MSGYFEPHFFRKSHKNLTFISIDCPRTDEPSVTVTIFSAANGVRAMNIPRRPVPTTPRAGSDRRTAFPSNGTTILTEFEEPENEPFIHSHDAESRNLDPANLEHVTESNLKPHGRISIRTPTSYQSLSLPSIKDYPLSDHYSWRPTTLGGIYLFLLGFISTALAIVVILLTWLSWSRSGLGDDNGTSILLFGWRFTPTLVAVLIVILESLLIEDVRRTEVFSRLSSPSPENAATTVLLGSRSWWHDPMDALSRRKNGGRWSQTLFYAAFMNIIGSFVLSPLSAAFFSSELTLMSQSIEFATFKSIQNSTFSISPDDETYFRSVSALVLNLSTSVWLTDNYAITPFWPTTLNEVPLGATVPEASQNWTAEVPVLQAQLSCMPMTLSNLGLTSFQLSSSDGCQVGIEVAVGPPPVSSALESAPDNEEEVATYYPIMEEGAWWVNTGISTSNFSTITESITNNQTSLVNVTQNCQGRYILDINTPFNATFSNEFNDTGIVSNTSTFQLRSYLCSTSYVSADLNVDLSISAPNTSVAFSEEMFNKSTNAIPSTNFDSGMFNDAFFNNYWMNKLNVSQEGGSYVGPALPLAAKYGYNVTAMLADPDLISTAQQVLQRFFGESVLAAFGEATPLISPPLAGSMTIQKQRIVASSGIGITLASILFLTTVMTFLVFFHSRASRRNLNLDRDPAPAVAIASLLKSEKTSSLFQGLDVLPDPLIKKRLETLTFALDRGGLIIQNENLEKIASKKDPPPPTKTYSKDWRPFVLQGWGGLALLLVLAFLITAISVLFAKSWSPGLYEAGLVYSHEVRFKNNYVASLAPYSVVPTLVAICIKSWWKALESVFKRVQPYVSMAKHPVTMSTGATLSYNTLPPVWSVWKAARNRHWLLALVCVGAALLDICLTVTMSALWERNIGSRRSSVQLTRTLMLRDVPELFNVPVPADPDSGDTETATILSQLYGDSQQYLSWMYGAVNQLSYAGANLAWTESDWSFSPINITAATTFVICLAILACLAVITVIIFLVDHDYFRRLPRDVDSLASVLALVYDSPKLRELLEQNQLLGGPKKAASGYTDLNNEDTKAFIGHFTGSHGDIRWGIEVIDSENGDKKTRHNSDDGYEMEGLRRRKR
ncbi:uncharacterized protein LY89DRAFT_789522 [Mollisia scopiformis]|uniref:Uncharacterized protein n=1 Tax=Mollisia scopiformis TaxID=149040 RepID=A0A132B634_MOLSC|nr:uncharacterized protein LY89DRAFT_789522 [Mollisia scopiformis]KUJ07862.1 hypothetical protein LY89DRAFT_789522 [Mollisia scopiformis]